MAGNKDEEEEEWRKVYQLWKERQIDKTVEKFGDLFSFESCSDTSSTCSGVRKNQNFRKNNHSRKQYRPVPSRNAAENPRRGSKPEFSRDMEDSGNMRENLLKEMECPVCNAFMIPPIIMCSNGHNICNNCRPQVDKCPVCRRPFTETRNKALENMAMAMKKNCKFSKYGCKFNLPVTEVTDHENLCLHRPYNCPLSQAQGINCGWLEPFVRLRGHITSKHKDRLTELTDVRRVCLKNVDFRRVYSRIIFACDQIFYQQFQVVNDVFYFVIQHVGPENCALKYQYNFLLSTPNCTESIRIEYIARSIFVNIGEIHKAGQCVKLFLNTVRNFMEKGEHLAFSFNICEAHSV